MGSNSANKLQHHENTHVFTIALVYLQLIVTVSRVFGYRE